VLPKEIEDPAGHIQLIEEGTPVTETFFVKRDNGRWVVVSSPDEGAIGYLARSGRLLRLFRGMSELRSDPELVSYDLALRITLAELVFNALRFPPVRTALSKENQATFLRALATRVFEASARSRAIGGLSPSERSFYLGRKLLEYAVGTVLEPLAAKAGGSALSTELKTIEQDIMLLLRAVRVWQDEASFRRLLVESRMSNDARRLFTTSADLRDEIQLRNGATAAKLFMIGIGVGVTYTSVVLAGGQSAGKDPAVEMALSGLRQLREDMRTLPNARPTALRAFAEFEQRIKQGNAPSLKEFEPWDAYHELFTQ
jgi:hypothetical protein